MEVITLNYFDRVVQEYSRKREDKVNEQILDANPEKSTAIKNLIEATYKKGKEVWLMTDWHFIKYNKENGSSFVRPETKTILSNAKSMIKPDDLLIFLGDICDGEIEDKPAIAHYISEIPGTKILVRGNNDLFPDSWYLDHGFKYVTPKFIWDNIIFTHRPQDNNNRINIHGHIHGSKKYYNSEISHYHNQIDVAWLGGREKPVKLLTVVGKQPAYASVITFVDKPWKNDTPIKDRDKNKK